MAHSPHFSNVQIEAMAKAAVHAFDNDVSGNIKRRLLDAGIDPAPSNSPRYVWLWLADSLNASQAVSGDASGVLQFIVLVVQSVSLNESPARQESVCASLNRVLHTTGYDIQPDGTLSKMGHLF